MCVKEIEKEAESERKSLTITTSICAMYRSGHFKTGQVK